MTVTTRVGISPETEIEWEYGIDPAHPSLDIIGEMIESIPDAYGLDFAHDPLARVSEILYQVAQSAKDEGRLVFAGQVIAARKIVQGLRDFAEG